MIAPRSAAVFPAPPPVVEESPAPCGMKQYDFAVKALLLATALLGTACTRPDATGIQVLPLRASRPIVLGDEARPGRTVDAGNRLRWPIPPSMSGVLEIGLGRLKSSPGEILVTARRGGLLRRVVSTTILPAGGGSWTTWNVPWSENRWTETFELEFRRRPGGGAVAAAPAILAEPLLVPERAGGPPPPGPNAVVFLVDTLRADRLGCYGDAAANTPQFDRLAREGWLVERALSTANWTLPAHASLFTSTEVARHGVNRVNPALPNLLPTLAERLRHAGYRTLAVTNGGYLDPHFGLARGFERYVVADIGKDPVETLVRRAEGVVRESRGAPWFLFFQTYQVHEYVHHLSPEEEAVRRATERSGILEARYRADVAITDKAFGDFRAALGRLGVADHTAIILTSDHGEILGETIDGCPARFVHGTPCLHDDENRIPFVVADPRAPGGGRRIDAPMSILDVAPTVLALLGVPPAPSFDGIAAPFASRAFAIPRDRRRVTQEPQSDSLAVERDRRKLIVRPDRMSILAKWSGKSSAARLAPVAGYDLSRQPDENQESPPGSERDRFAILMADASALVGESFPGSLLVRLPPSSAPIRVTVDVADGLRRFDKFAGGEPERDRLDTRPGGISATIAPAAGPSWLVFEPRRRLAALAIDISGARSLRLGNGTIVAQGETRSRWASLLAAPGGVSREDDVLLFASRRARPAEALFDAPAAPSAAIAQLRSLGYLNSAGQTAPAAATALGGEGTGQLRIRWSDRLP